jgi:hypothetical protein
VSCTRQQVQQSKGLFLLAQTPKEQAENREECELLRQQCRAAWDRAKDPEAIGL